MVKVRWATVSKSKALMMVSSGGFSWFKARLAVAAGGGLVHSVSMVLVSRVPMSFDGSRFLGSREGAWTAEYGSVASRPACSRIAEEWSVIVRLCFHSRQIGQIW